MKLSEQDKRVLRLLQQDASKGKLELSELANLSASTLWRRVRELEETGIIDRTVAILNPDKVGAPVCFIVQVNMKNHHAKTLLEFDRLVQKSPEITECYSMTGSFDYMLIVRTSTVASFEEFLMKQVLTNTSVANASSSVSLHRTKYTTEIQV